jgi:hypothetical protein
LWESESIEDLDTMSSPKSLGETKKFIVAMVIALVVGVSITILAHWWDKIVPPYMGQLQFGTYLKGEEESTIGLVTSLIECAEKCQINERCKAMSFTDPVGNFGACVLEFGKLKKLTEKRTVSAAKISIGRGLLRSERVEP